MVCAQTLYANGITSIIYPRATDGTKVMAITRLSSIRKFHVMFVSIAEEPLPCVQGRTIGICGTIPLTCEN